MSNKSSIDSIQILRGLAATAVVVHHAIRGYTINVPASLSNLHQPILGARWLYESLAAGVDIFFVISGFIMIYVSRPYANGTRPVSDFLARRVIRVYPPYLIITAIFLLPKLLSYLHGKYVFDLSPLRLLGALTLFPTLNESGMIQPIVGVGWTLSYEVYFYLAFTVALFVGGERFFWALTSLLCIILAAANLTGSNITVIRFLHDPIIFEFLCGCVLGKLYLARKLPKLHPVFLLLSVGVILIAGGFFLANETHPLLRFVFWGIPAATIVWSLLHISTSSTRSWSRIPLLLGNASYSVYLIHTFVIYQVIQMMLKRVHLPGLPLLTDILILGSVAAATFVGVLFHLFVEKPTVSTLNEATVNRLAQRKLEPELVKETQ